MSPSRQLRASPSRLKPSTKTALEPAQIPLPPSPPASDANIISDPFAHRSSSPPPTLRRISLTSDRGCHDAQSVNGPPLTLKTTSTRTRPKRHRVAQDQFDSSSPPTSPTNRKSARSIKRLKLSSPPSRKSLRAPATSDHRDTPNNPFLAKPGDKPRRADSRRDGGRRQLTYVFRGKRIPYDTTEDLNHAGGSPFNLSGPRLLFPSPPSPAPAPKLKFELEEPEGSSLLSSPQRRNPHRNQLAFQTPKRDKMKSNLASPAMLPTPQSRPRRTQHGHRSLSNQALAGVVKSGRTMAQAMR